MNHIDSILIGESAAMRQLRAQIARFGPTRLPVLVQGPTGSGKELVARALHLASRRSGALVAFNVCAVSDTMFEDAVFGHVRGAFTGATSDRLGYLAEANGGTVFFDEIGGAGLGSQLKLLRAIETGTFRAVGAAVDRVSDFRVVSATNESLDALAGAGRFRADLRHRLAGVVLDVPPLSARLEDVAVLSGHFLRLAHGERATISSRATRRLESYPWPGNVRELRHALERALILADGGCIEVEHVEHSVGSEVIARETTTANRSAAYNTLVNVLTECNWDISATARMLGVHRATVYRRMRQLGLLSREFALQSRDNGATLGSGNSGRNSESIGEARVS